VLRWWWREAEKIQKNDHRENQEMKKGKWWKIDEIWTRRRKSQAEIGEIFVCVFEDVERCVRVDLLSPPSRYRLSSYLVHLFHSTASVFLFIFICTFFFTYYGSCILLSPIMSLRDPFYLLGVV
jgi:hypothetical protein